MVKIGSGSIILEHGEYGKYVKKETDKIIKVTKLITNHNDFIHSKEIKTIKNYKQYYSFPEEEVNLLFPSDDFYKYIQYLVKDIEINIFGNFLIYFSMDKAGDKEVYDTIIDMLNKDFSFWNSYKTIINFTNKILDGLNYLHEKQICHLDIKAENIMVNTKKKTYKIIDFGFCSKFPFNDYVDNLRGTPGYFPKQYDINTTPWFPEIKANDLSFIGGEIIIKINRSLIYKIDSFCLGRLLNYIKYVYDDNRIYGCFNNERNNGKKLNKIINSLIENNIFERLNPIDCLIKYFNNY